MDRYAWLDKEKPCAERSRTISQGRVGNLEIRKAVREIIDDLDLDIQLVVSYLRRRFALHNEAAMDIARTEKITPSDKPTGIL